MATIHEIREKYRETLAEATKALAELEASEAVRRAAALALEAKRAHDAAAKIAKLREKIQDYTNRLKATGVET